MKPYHYYQLLPSTKNLQNLYKSSTLPPLYSFFECVIVMISNRVGNFLPDCFLLQQNLFTIGVVAHTFDAQPSNTIEGRYAGTILVQKSTSVHKVSIRCPLQSQNNYVIIILSNRAGINLLGCFLLQKVK